jgi:2-hydroxy-3-keto-5-methylthiopentenyl-1-phosphate phosphatase
VTDWVIFCDFDGTICIPDSCDFLLSRFADERWKELDEAVWRGDITEREAFFEQIALLRVSWPDAQSALHDGVKIREGFPAFVEFCRARQLPMAILSSGLCELIDILLKSVGVRDLPFFAHRAEISGDRWRVIPFDGLRLKEHCSHCKCAHLEAARNADKKIIYIGDGYTDLCPAPRADLIFATGKLAAALDKEHRPFIPFTTFGEIERDLERLLQ